MPDPVVATTADGTAPDSGPPVVTVRYWAAARAAAGRVEDTVEGVQTVQAALAAVHALHDDARFRDVLSVSSLVLGDQPVHREHLADVPVTAGDVIEVLPPFAGG
jgi:molybdopterin converting factor small subunit